MPIPPGGFVEILRAFGTREAVRLTLRLVVFLVGVLAAAGLVAIFIGPRAAGLVVLMALALGAGILVASLPGPRKK